MNGMTNLDQQSDAVPEKSLTLEEGAEIATVHQPHRKVMHPVMLPAFVEGDDVRMIKQRDGIDFNAKAQAGFIRKHVMRLHHLQCNQPVEAELAGAINDTHAAASDFVQKLIVAEIA